MDNTKKEHNRKKWFVGLYGKNHFYMDKKEDEWIEEIGIESDSWANTLNIIDW